MSRETWPKKTGDRHTIKSLGLDLKSAAAGKTWLLLPDGYRDSAWGMKYPLPARRQELQKLVAIDIPPHMDKRDCGCLYIRRAIQEWKGRAREKNSMINDLSRRGNKIENTQREFNRLVKNLKLEGRQAIEEVRQEAALQIASLNDLFALGRKGIEGQMKAYLAGKEYQGEEINKRDFQACFRMVTQAVKGLGLPSEQRAIASDAVVEQVAKALRSTQEAIAMSKPPEGEKPN